MNKIKITEFKIILKDYYLVSTNKIYSSRHWTYRNKIKKDYAMWFLKYKNKLPKFDYKIDLEFNFYFKNKGYDSSNVSLMGKIIEDLLVKDGVIKDDNRRWVGRVSYVSRKGDENYCELIIKKSKMHFNTKHGHYTNGTYTSTYTIWQDMKRRCLNKKAKDYPRYGGKGIEVCKRWLKFENFLEDMGERPKNLTLDRIENSKGYSKDNCRWVTWKQQQRNRSNNRMLTYNNKTKCFAEWCEELNLNRSMVKERLKRGWSVKKAFEIPKLQ
jgi:hypothetical protein